MPKPKMFLIGLILFFCTFSFLMAASIHIPGDYGTIQEGINAAASGDSIIVAPGIYQVNLDFLGKAITLGSIAGPALTELWPSDTTRPIVQFITGETSSTTLTGFTIGHAWKVTCIRIDGASPNIVNNHFTNNNGGMYINDAIIYIINKSHALIKNNLFHNPGTYISIADYSDTNQVIVNNTIYGGNLGMYLGGEGSLVANNIVTGCARSVSGSGTTTVRTYNDIWGNTNNGSLAPTDISVDPEFIDTLSDNFGLLRSSGCIDAGDPNPIYNDLDGTRNDIGAFYFDQHIPAVYNLDLGAENIAHVINHTPTFEWSYYDTTELTQIGYEVEIGELDGTDIWTTGQIMSSDNFATYGGPPLQDGTVYYCNVRVFNGDFWGNWKVIKFRMNLIPDIPVAVWPLNVPVSNYGVRLLVYNSSVDVSGYPLMIDFEIASSPGGTPVASLYNVPAQPAQTGSGIFKQDWPVGVDYYWRTRAFDGFEYSDWCTPQPFVTRAPIIIQVPADYATIQAGIDAAQEKDTVLVAPGTYTGDGNRDLTFRGTNLVVRSSDGAEATIIDCQAGYMNAHWGFYLNGYEDSTALIEGFTIKNSFTDELGAIYLTTSSPTISGCIITENDGSGIMAVSDNYRWANRQKVHIKSCTITNNTNHGIYSFSAAEIWKCLISYNGMDGVNLLWPDSIDMVLNLVRGNTGDGLHYETMSAGNWINISNNTFVGNNRGLYYYWEPPKGTEAPAPSMSSTSISKNIFAFNRQYGTYADGLGIWGVTCCNAYGNPSGDWFPDGTYSPHAGDTLGNISANPLFCDTTAGDFRIAAISPCAAANNSCGVLIGNFGVGCDFLCGDVNLDGTINLKDITALIEYLYLDGPVPPGLSLADVNSTGNVNIKDIGYLILYLYKSGPAPNCP